MSAARPRLKRRPAGDLELHVQFGPEVRTQKSVDTINANPTNNQTNWQTKSKTDSNVEKKVGKMVGTHV